MGHLNADELGRLVAWVKPIRNSLDRLRARLAEREAQPALLNRTAEALRAVDAIGAEANNVSGGAYPRPPDFGPCEVSPEAMRAIDEAAARARKSRGKRRRR